MVGGEGGIGIGSYFNYLCTYDLYGPVRNVIDECRYITRASGSGGHKSISLLVKC